MTVLVIACPHALGLAIPLVVSLSSAIAASNGVLVKDRLALERMRNVDAVLFDKTGTLTTGRPSVAGVIGHGRFDEAEVLRIAGAVEADSEHPVAKAIVAAATARGPVPTASGFRSMTGSGVEATVDGVTYAMGGPALLRERGLDAPDAESPTGCSGARPCCTSSGSTPTRRWRSSGRSRSRTRCALRRRLPSRSCSDAASGS